MIRKNLFRLRMICVDDTLINPVSGTCVITLRDDASLTKFNDNLALHVPVDNRGQIPKHNRHVLVTDDLVHLISTAT